MCTRPAFNQGVWPTFVLNVAITRNNVVALRGFVVRDAAQGYGGATEDFGLENWI